MRTVKLLSLLALLPPVTLRAQDACGEFLKSPDVGDWAEYRVSKDGEEEIGLRFALVGTEQRAGNELSWFEMTIRGDEEDEVTILKLLVPAYPFEPDGLEEIVMKSGGGPAMKMGGPMLATIRGTIAENPGLSMAEQCRKMQKVGEESVTVPAGTFMSQRFTNSEEGGEAWLSSELPFGMVKSTDEDYTVELIDHGDGATTAITETPQDIFGS